MKLIISFVHSRILSPDDRLAVHRLTKNKIFTKRQAGADLTSCLNPTSCELILGIKEIPFERLIESPTTTYAFFGHIHKGQSNNLPLLRSMISSHSRFIDYELLTCSTTGTRTTAFGFLAGVVGMSDGLSQFSLKALAQGSPTPFLHLPRPFMMKDGEELRKELRKVGEEIRERGIPKSLGPVVVVVAGKGRVGEGARSVLNELPTEWIEANQLKSISRGNDHVDLRKIYACQLNLGDYLTNKDGSEFDREVYRSNPEQFISEFDTKVSFLADVSELDASYLFIVYFTFRSLPIQLYS